MIKIKKSLIGGLDRPPVLWYTGMYPLIKKMPYMTNEEAQKQLEQSYGGAGFYEHIYEF